MGVAIADINAEQGAKALKELHSKFGENSAIFAQTDVSKDDQFKKAFEATIKKWGCIDILINNAGVLREQQWEMSVAINCGGVVRGTLLGIQHMGKATGGKGGIIVNMASIAGISYLTGAPIYTATKHFVLAFGRTVGSPTHSEQTGIKIVTICPGVTETSIIHVGEGTALTSINKNMGELLDKELSSFSSQPPENVANGLISVMQNAPTGTVWVIMDNKPPFEAEDKNKL